MFGRKRNTVDVVTATEMVINDGYIIVDVRTKDEWKKGHAVGATHISLASLDNRLKNLEGKQVLAICQTGSRSKKATSIMNRHGIEALNVKGGMNAWGRAGLPTKKGS
jgi:rhodanese-related sulfurtransferase